MRCDTNGDIAALTEEISIYRDGSSAQGHCDIDGGRRTLNQQIVVKVLKMLTTEEDL